MAEINPTEAKQNTPAVAPKGPEVGINAAPKNPEIKKAAETLPNALVCCDAMTRTCVASGDECVKINTKTIESQKQKT